MKPRKPQLPKSFRLPTTNGEELDRADRARRLVADGAQLLAAKRAEEAAAKLARAWELDPHNAAAAINLGGAYILLGRHDRAIPPLEAVAQLEPDNAMIWTNLAAAYLGKLPFATRDRQERAISAFERALEIDPHAPHVSYNLGLIYLEREQIELARANFAAALEADPNDRDAQRYLDRLANSDSSAETPDDLT